MTCKRQKCRFVIVNEVYNDLLIKDFISMDLGCFYLKPPLPTPLKKEDIFNYRLQIFGTSKTTNLMNVYHPI